MGIILTSFSDGRSLTKEFDCKFVEIAVALGHHVDELLVGIVAQVKQWELQKNTQKQIDSICSQPTKAGGGGGGGGGVDVASPQDCGVCVPASTAADAFRCSPRRQQQEQQLHALRRSST